VKEKRGEDLPLLTRGRCSYFPASGRFPWFAFFMRSFFSLRRRVLAMTSSRIRVVAAGGGPRETKKRRAPCARLSVYPLDAFPCYSATRRMV
jgi:hypothetical protein